MLETEQKIYDTLKNIQANVIKNLPYYSVFKQTDESKYKVSTNELTDTQKKDIETLIFENNHLFGYTKDTLPILTFIIKYSTTCTDVVKMVANLPFYKRGPAKGVLTYMGKSTKEIQNKLDNVINYFYYYPNVTEHIGYSLEKRVGVPQDLVRGDFDMSYEIHSNIIYKKDGKKLKGMITDEIKKSKFQVLNLKDGIKYDIEEKDILGFAEMTDPGNGIISHLFTNQNIDAIEEDCNTIGKKCDKTGTLDKRNSVICSLKNGASIINKIDPIKICTECIKEPEVMSNTSMQQQMDPSSMDQRQSLSSIASSESTLTQEESDAYETFKKAVCASGLNNTSETHKKEIGEKEEEIQTLKRELNTQGLRVLPNLRKRSQYKEDQVALTAEKKPGLLRRIFTRKGGKKKSSTKKKTQKKKTHKKKTHKKKTRKSRK